MTHLEERRLPDSACVGSRDRSHRKAKELAREIGTSYSNMRDLKKYANSDTGLRHASESGVKVRADPETYGTWACGLVDAINGGRSRFEAGIQRMAPSEAARVVSQAIRAIPYR